MYHGWTYNLDGSLRTTPEFEGVKGFDPANFGLRPVRVDTWGPFVFVNLSPEGPSLAEWLGSEIDAKRTKVTYWMGVVRVRTLVAQVGFTPTTKVDLSRAEFDALVVRARDRLKILSRSAT